MALMRSLVLVSSLTKPVVGRRIAEPSMVGYDLGLSSLRFAAVFYATPVSMPPELLCKELTQALARTSVL